MAAGALFAAVLVVALLAFRPNPDVFADLQPTDGPFAVAAVLPQDGLLPGSRGADCRDSGLILAGSDSQQLYRLDDEGSIVETIGIVPQDGSAVSEPVDVACNGDAAYVVDTAGEGRLLVLPKRGATTEFETLAKIRPTAVACEGDEVFVADSARSRILVFSKDGLLLKELGATVSPKLGFVGGLFVDGDQVWVSDSSVGRVLALSRQTGDPVAIIDRQMSLPRGLTRDSWGRLYVADEFARRVQVFDSKGTHLFEMPADDSGGDGTLAGPRDVAWIDGRLWVIDAASDKIVVYNVREPAQ
jgi:DNA-binding beta-propeller fold protein YncE